MKSIDEFFSKRYHDKNYNCSHFVRDVWLHLTDADLTGIACAWNSGDLAQSIRARSDISRLEKPETPCIVLLQANCGPPHAGIWIDDQIFHLVETGPRVDDFAIISAAFRSWNFYKCSKQ